MAFYENEEIIGYIRYTIGNLVFKLEEHRHLPITVQAKDLWHSQLMDDLIIGNMYASEEEFEALDSFIKSQVR